MQRPRPKYQVFISSTFVDLRAEREAVTWAILEARQIPAGMENFTATDDRGWKLIQRAINLSDYYVLILAGRYGSFDETVQMSWTHREYLYAVELGIPVLAFLREPAAITQDKAESDPEQQGRLRSFIADVKSRHQYAMWTQAADLREAVVQSLRNTISDDEDSGHPRLGWFRGDEVPSNSSIEEFARLSAEATELRRQLAEHSSRKAVLSLGWRDSDDAHLVVRRELLHLTEAEELAMSTQVKMATRLVRDKTPNQQLAELATEFILELVLKNNGSGAARNVTVDLTIDRTEVLLAYRRQPLFGSRKEPRELDPQEHVHIAKTHRDPTGKASVRQRVRLVPPGGTESLVSVILYLYEGQEEVNVTYHVRDEDGATAEGSLRGTINWGGTRTITSQEAHKLGVE